MLTPGQSRMYDEIDFRRFKVPFYNDYNRAP